MKEIKTVRPDLIEFLENNPLYEKKGKWYKHKVQSWNITKEMIKMAGQPIEVKKLERDEWSYSYSDGQYRWALEWFEPSALEGVEL